MKHFCFLFSFVVVTVLAVNIADYKNKMDQTNKHIELAGDRLHEVIKSFVCGRYSMEEIAIMLAAPEFAVARRGLRKCIHYENSLQQKIYKELKIKAPEYVEKYIHNPDYPNKYVEITDVSSEEEYYGEETSGNESSGDEFVDDEKKNIVVPDGENKGIPVPENEEKNNEISDDEKKNVVVPVDEFKGVTVPDQNVLLQNLKRNFGFEPIDFKDRELFELGKVRREMTEKVTQEMVTSLEQEDIDPDFTDIKPKCRLLGLLTSIVQPEAYIIRAKNRGDSECLFKSIDKSKKIEAKPVPGTSFKNFFV
ncbi:uncharacterized protein LOC126847899 isoform X1 [Adelges cooleyi]|uniref:uncharacterized protein LOC126847899 isoform X1 n=1 Tax=Adelges cooleyi TaxID=133065 RepID=UPI00217FCE05|nr:uncharacterized protein LOC126847899 isoform X1 [Adelges cooleyi]XP_050444268.1 uncharacterized protein LOC126847899 isoform X1 [Adelges cooleyi]XP_050444269.1 uncharacterized protein LOC126847899 isoform X1 [Adelges cooleyi]